MTIKLQTDDKGKLKTDGMVIKSQSLYPKYNYPGLSYLNKYKQEVQSAFGNVVVQYTDKDGVTNEYAIISDNFNLLDSDLWTFDNNFGAGKQFGGKLGIVKDPFGKKGDPVYLGATTPLGSYGYLIPGMIWDLHIGSDGKLYGNVWTDSYVYADDDTDKLNPLATRLNKNLFVWDASKLVEMAEAAYKNNKGITSKPFDLKSENGKDVQISPPQKIDGTSSDGVKTDDLFGWIVGIGKYASTSQVVNLKASGYSAYFDLVTNPYYGAGQDDNVYTDAMGISRTEIAKKIQNGEYDGYDASWYYLKTGLYNTWDFATLGFVGRNAERVKQNDAGVLSDSEYGWSAGIDAVGTVGAMIIGNRVGTAVEARYGAGFYAMASEAVTFAVVDTYAQSLIYKVTDGKTGTGNSSEAFVNSVSMDMIVGAGLHLASRLNFGAKVLWKMPTEGNTFEYKIVMPTSRADIEAKYLFTKADSTGRSLILGDEVPILPQDKANAGLWYYVKNLQKAVRQSDWKNAQANIQGVVAFLEKTNPNKQHEHNIIYEQQGEGNISIMYEFKDKNGNVTDRSRSTISTTLVYINPSDGGMYYIKVGDSRVMLTILDEHGNPVLDPVTGKAVKEFSTVTMDTKSASKWRNIETNIGEQVELLESLYRASKALDDNKEYSHLLEFERAETVSGVVDFLDDYHNNPSKYSAMMDEFKSKYPNTYAQMSKETGALSWLNERIYFAEANKFDTSLGYRPNPENWIGFTKTAEGALDITEVTRTQLLQDGKIKKAKDLTDPSRDFVNSDMFKQAMEKQTNDGFAINYQKIQSFDTQDHTCFVGGTLVHTERGLVQIKDVQIGERVLSADPITGQQSYQAVTKVIKTENKSVIFMQFKYQINPELSLFERIKLNKEIRKKFGIKDLVLPHVQLVVTSEHPFWVDKKGWVTAQQITDQDVVVDKDGNKYCLSFDGYNVKPHAQIYTTADTNVGLMPNYGLESSCEGIPVDLFTGNIISWNETIKNNPNLRKLYSKNTQWKEDLLEQLPQEDRANAHFHGFSQGDWVNPETIQWEEGEGYVTTTVYNLEVENTHTYFVGQYGIWVHNCGGEDTAINNLTLEMVESLYPTAKQYWIDAGISEYEINQKLSHYSFDVRQLADSAAALTDLSQIVFSPDAAGSGWFVDSTPKDSSEFNMSPTDSGTAINSDLKKQVDLLTVFIHEIGHVLGLVHVGNDHDIMSSVLETGVRRLPTHDDIAQWLDSANTNENLSFSGLQLLIKRNTQSSATSTWNSDITVSPQFVELTQSSPIWKTQGKVTLGESSAVLQEADNSQTNLSQAFKVGEYDRVLTFTVKDQQLSDYNNSPDDAFEVALLDAKTGEALFKVNDLNKTDALFNLQANGTYSVAQGIDRVVNADGTQTFFINLDQALVGRDVLLSFDLLGFGAADSHVTLSNIRMVAESMALNDQYKLNEDTVLSGNVLNNDILIRQSVDNVVLVSTPQHGELMLKANGEFSYTPHANYFGTDQFSYYFVTSDGTESKVATVNLDIQPVNDAPEFVQQPDWEIIAGQPLLLNFEQYVQDAEHDNIQITISQQSQSGSITYDAQTEPYRVCRRVNILRDYPDEKSKIYP